MATIDQLDLDSLIEDNSKLNTFLNHLKQNPNEIAKTVRALLKQAHEKDYEIAEKDEEQEEGEEYLTQALDMCLMIAANTKEYDAYFKDLVEQNIIKTNVCGTIWQDGDEAYKCTTCELDSSCAICVDCFNAGNHTGHNFKRIKVAGGVCDCGDFQAWKPSGFCPKHRGISDEEDSLPPYLRDALRQIIIEILSYLNGVLSEIQDLDDDLKNDFYIRDAIMVTQWLEEFFKRGDSLRKLLAEEWIQIDNDGNSLLDIVMKHYPQLPEDVAEGIHNLFFPLLFVPTFRKRFLQRHFIPYYRENIESHISRGANEKEILSDFPVQLFTVANCTNILKEEKMLEILGGKMYTIFSRAATDTTYSSMPTVDPEDDMIFSHLYYRLTADCNYILAHKDMSHYFLYHSNSELVDMWSRVLKLIQCMNRKSNKRVLEGHAEFDSEIWIPAFLLDLELTSLLPLFLEGANFHNAKRNQTRYPQVVKVIIKHLQEWLATENDLNFKVSEGANSYHLPLHRYLAGLISEGMKNWNFKLNDLVQSAEFANLAMEHPLRIQVFVSQIKVDMWNRNGREVGAQCETYNSVYFRDIFRDLDVFLLQICSILVGPFTFISRVLKKYELYDWMTCDGGMKFDSESPNSKLLEEFLRFVVVIATERTKAGATTEHLIRKEIIHRLAVEDHTHSQLANTIESTLVDHVDFEKILSQVANFHEPKQMEQGTYSIKEECWDEFDRYFSHYSRAELEKAEERYSKARKSRMASYPLPVYPSLSSLYFPLYSQMFYKILFSVFYSATVDPTKVTETLMNEALQALHLSISLYNSTDIINAKDSEELNSHNNNNNNNKRKIIAFNGNILDLEFPTSFNVTQNSRHEVIVAGIEEKGESLISLLRKITKLQQYVSFGDKVKNILRLFSEKDISCRQYIEILAGKEKHEGKEQSKEEDLEEEQEAKKRRKERQAAIMQKMKQDMAKFKVEPTEEIEESGPHESNPFPDVSMNCPLCHEEHSLSSKPLGFVGLVQPTKILQIAKELQLRKKEEKQLFLEEETPIGPRTPLRSPHPYGESDVESDDFDYLEEEDDDEEDDQERLLADKDADRVTRAQAYMFSLMHDPIADQFQDEEDFEDDDDMDDFALMSNEHLENEDNANDDHPENEDVDIDSVEPQDNVDQAFAEAIEDEEDIIQDDNDEEEEHDDHEIPEEDEEEQAVGNTSFMSHFLSGVMGNAMDTFEINEIEKAYVQVEKSILQLESNPFSLDADSKLEELEDQVEGLDDVLEELREDGVPPEDLEKIEQKRKELREKMVGLIRHIKKPVFDLTRGMHLNVQYCNNHTIHADCLERYLLKLVERYNNSESYEGEDVIDLERGEYLCVVCRRLANSLVPIIPYHTTFEKMGEISMKFQEWVGNLEILKSESFLKPTSFNFTAPMTTVLEKYTQGLSEGKSGIIATETTDEEKDLFAAETLASSFGNSLAAIELSLRGKGPLLDITEKSHHINLRSQFLLCMAYRYHKMNSPALLYHQKLLYSIIKGVTTNKSCPLMSLDLFSALLQLILIWPRPVTIKTDFVYLSQMMYQAAIGQVILEIYYGKVTVSDEDISSVRNAIEKNTKIKCDIKFIKQLVLPFLRCTALFAYTCLEMPLPEISDDVDDDFDESDYLEQFLHLPKISLLLSDLLSKESMFHLWHQDIKNTPDMLPQLAPPEPFQLIQLPTLYHDLLQKYNKVRCVVCKTNPNTKAICLVCGMLVCAGNNCCRDARGIGEATKHAFQCGAGVGLFLILKMSSVLVIRDDRHSFWGSPYLDEHGEEDLHLIRGRPLYFNKERYEQLTQLYVNQRLEYDAKITETTTLGEAEWY